MHFLVSNCSKKFLSTLYPIVIPPILFYQIHQNCTTSPLSVALMHINWFIISLVFNYSLDLYSLFFRPFCPIFLVYYEWFWILQEGDSGLFISHIVENSPSASANLQVGDKLILVNGEAVANKFQHVSILILWFPTMPVN